MTTAPNAATLHNFFSRTLLKMERDDKRRATVDELTKVARQMLDGARSTAAKITWGTAARSTVSAVRRKAALLQPVRVFGRIVRMRDPELLQLVPEDDVEMETTTILIEGSDGASIWSLDVVGRELVDKLEAFVRLGVPLEFLGMSVCADIVESRAPGGELDSIRRKFFFFLVDVRQSVSALDAIGADDSERRLVESWTSVPEDDFIDDAVEELIFQLHIAGVDEFPLLKDLIEFTVLQALSCGQVLHAPGRLHLLLAGPPGQGKKLVGLAAKILNPRCAELSASKVSPAGLVGASRHDPVKGWISEPGLLPLAADGVALLQDAHGWNDAVVKAIGPILQEVIEDGVVRNASAGGVTRYAPVSLVIDANRTTHLDATGAGRRVAEAPILRLRPLLSRIDVLCEIPPDVGRAWRVARSMYDRLKAEADGSDTASWARVLRLHVAHLRDTYPTIDLDGVRASMRDVHDELRAKNEPHFATMPEAGDVPTRLTISFARLVAASARGGRRSVATDKDVQRAVRFLNMKLNFLRMVEASPVQLSGWPKADGLRTWLGTFAGTVVQPAELAKSYEIDTGDSVSERTVRRALSELGANHAGKGKWRLPAPR
jgi:hypothetical protein